MATNIQAVLRDQILDRRQELEFAAQAIGENPEIAQLLHEVDAGLKPMIDIKAKCRLF
jgi:hypothetical protein